MVIIVDRLSKYAHFLALSRPRCAAIVPRVFLDNIFKLHGLPLSVVSDRDLLFTSNFWKELFKPQGTQLKHSSTYHPQTDGQSEVVNRCVGNYLWCFVGTSPKDWVKWLPLVEWWYNTCSDLTTGISPFEAVYGYPPPQLLSYIKGTTNEQVVDELLWSKDQISKIL